MLHPNNGQVATPTAACPRCVAGQLAVPTGTLCQTAGSNWGPRDRDRLHPRGEQHRGDALLPGHPPGAARPPGSPDMEARGHGGRQKKRLQVVNRPKISVPDPDPPDPLGSSGSSSD